MGGIIESVSHGLSKDTSLRILVAFEEAASGDRVARALLDRLPCQVERVADLETIAVLAGSAPPFQVLLSDDSLVSGREQIERIHQIEQAPEIVVLTEPGSPIALDLLRAGAFQCLDPTVSGEELEIAVRRAAEMGQLRAAARRAEQLETLRTISLAMTSTFERDDLLRTIIEAAVGLLEAESGGIYEYHPGREELTIIAEFRRPEHFGTTLKVGAGIAGRLVENGQLYMIVDDYNSWDGRASVYNDQRPFGAVLAVPLRWRESVIGILYVDDRVGRNFKIHEANLLIQFADQAAIALASSNLAQRNEARRRKLLKLAEATQEIMAAVRTRSLDDLLEPIARYLADITDAELAGVFLVRRQGFLRLEASFGHRPDAFHQGAEFEIVSGVKTGLTGHIAYEGNLVNLHGDKLIHHPAVRGEESAGPSRRCYSLLAIPLKKKSGGQETVAGLLRAENKKSSDGNPHLSLSFTDEDEEVIKIFAEAVVVALELAERKDLLNRLVESSPDGIIAVDQQGNVTLFNEQAERVLEYRKDEVQGTHVGRLYADPREPNKIGSKLHGREDGRLLNYETAIKSKSEEIIPIRHSSTWIYNSRGERIGSVGYFQDLRSLRLVEKRLESLLEANAIVAGAQSHTEGLSRLTQMLASLLPHTFCRILLWDEARSCLDVEAVEVSSSIAAPKPLKAALSKRMEISDWPGLDRLLEHGEPKLLSAAHPPDVSTLQRLSRWLGLAQDLQHLLIAPLRLAQRSIGLIELGELDSARPISQEEIDFASQIADNITALIDRRRLSADAELRGQLLGALVDASQTMLRERETSKLLPQIIRLAVELVGCTAGGLFENRPHLEELELTASYDIPDQPAWKVHGRSQTHYEGLVGEAASSGETCVDRHYQSSSKRDPLFADLSFETAAAVPLKISNEVEAVLFLADETGHQQFGAATLDILDRFAVQASMALHLSRLMNPEVRSFRHLKLLHEISDYIQQSGDLDKILHVVLTGITAGYGLGFNRAALFLYDEPRERLVGRMGIGHLDKNLARKDWETGRQKGFEQFSAYLKALDSGELPETPVARAVRDLVLPLRREEPDALSRAVITRLHELLTDERHDELPEQFRKAFLPATDLLVVPLKARGEILGVLVADNMVNSLPITQDDLETLLAFVSTAAIAINNHRLLQETQIARERLETCFQASNALVSPQNPEQVLKDILEKTPGTEREKAWVKLMLVDELGTIQKQMIAGTTERPELLVTELRPTGLTMQVMRNRKPWIIEDSSTLVPPDDSPFMQTNGIQASIGLPLLLHGNPIGVMWINYDHPRRFEPFEIHAMQLYVNQSAMAYDSARRMDDLRRLHTAAQEISNAHNLHDLLHTIAHQALQVCSAQVAVLWPYDTEQVEFVTAEAVVVGVTPEGNQLLRELESDLEDLADLVRETGWLGVPDVLQSDGLPISPKTGMALKQAKFASFQGVPLSVGEERVGILHVGYNQVRSFGEQDRRTIEAFASNAALSLNNIRLFERIQKAKQAAQLVAQVTTLEKRDTTLQTIADAVLEALRCSAVVLFSYAIREDRWSYPPAHSGVRYPGKAWPKEEEGGFSRSIVPKILHLPEPHVAEEIDKSDLLCGHQFAKDEGIASCVAIPLEAANQKVGVMFVNYRRHHRFTPENLRDIELFAYQAAVAIRNAQLFRALEKDQLRALQEFQHQIRGPIFQVHSRLQKLVADPPADSGQADELEIITALSAKARRVSTYLQLYSLLSRGEEIKARNDELKISELIKLVSEIALHASLTASRGPVFSFRVDEVSFMQAGFRALIIDRNLVEHAIGNILDNAFKYSYPGTEVRIEGGKTDLGDFRITVINQGVPINPEEVEKCCERGWQSPHGKITSSEGQGIGLWIVDNIMRSLGGGLDIKPTANDETHVSLLFPIGRAS